MPGFSTGRSDFIGVENWISRADRPAASRIRSTRLLHRHLRCFPGFWLALGQQVSTRINHRVAGLQQSFVVRDTLRSSTIIDAKSYIGTVSRDTMLEILRLDILHSTEMCIVSCTQLHHRFDVVRDSVGLLYRNKATNITQPPTVTQIPLIHGQAPEMTKDRGHSS